MMHDTSICYVMRIILASSFKVLCKTVKAFILFMKVMLRKNGMTRIIYICHDLKFLGPHIFCMSCASGYLFDMISMDAYTMVLCTL